jgi:hypothetical protein
VGAGNPDFVPSVPGCLILHSSIFSLGKLGDLYVTKEVFCLFLVVVGLALALALALALGEGIGDGDTDGAGVGNAVGDWVDVGVGVDGDPGDAFLATTPLFQINFFPLLIQVNFLP